jgi:ATPase components of various ABC-type transport systems, contain duplicated ATPase
MLEGKNITKDYTLGYFSSSVKHVLKDIHICFKREETVAIVGESGCGKTTLAKVLTMQLPATKGEVYFDDAKLSSLPRKELKPYLRRIQLIPQNPDDAVDPRWTAFRSVKEPLEIAGSYSENEMNEIVCDLFAEVGLSETHMRRYPHELSGGELQRVVIARALTLEPEILICDEATSMLDVSVQANIITILKKIQEKRKIGLVLITHDINLARVAADRVIVMYDGEIVEEGKNVLEKPNHPYTKKMVSAAMYLNVDNEEAMITSEK